MKGMPLLARVGSRGPTFGSLSDGKLRNLLVVLTS